jgi:two-component system, cell cycle response regulator DivK
MDWIDKSVLIAEDEEANYLLMVEYLEPTRIQIIRACNGVEVLKIMKIKVPDIILMDLKMPLMTGIEATEIIRQSNSTIPIIAQTAFAMQGDRDKILRSGFNEILTKPIGEEELLVMLKKYLKSQGLNLA